MQNIEDDEVEDPESKLQEEFEKTYKEVNELTNSIQDEISKLILKLESIAEEKSVPVHVMDLTYFPKSMEEKFGELDLFYIHDVVGFFNRDNVSNVWMNSSYEC